MPTDGPDNHRRSIRLREYDYAQPGGYFVTICTHDHKCLFGGVVDSEMHLNELGEIVATEWLQTAEIRSEIALDAFVVMPNHVHAVFVQHPSWPLEKLLRSWKSFTSRKINPQLSREGTLWQRDYFDRLVRDQKHFANCVRYIRRNPERAGLRSGEYILYESELARSVE